MKIRWSPTLTFCLAASTLGAGFTAHAADWPQWRGPGRTGISGEAGWAARWPAAGPRKVWSAKVGEGYSSAVVAGGRLYTTGNSGNQDTVVCLNADTGKPVWRYSYPCAAGDYGGPRATPTVSGNLLYTLSREGQAFCFNTANGRPVWSKNLARETGAESPRWGFAGSPLVLGNQVIYNIGGAGTAVDKGTGKIVWKSGGGVSGYASPLPFQVGSQKGVAIFVGNAIVGVNPANGRELWRHGWDTQYDVNAADPIFYFDNVFVSSNYGKGCALIRLAGGRPAVAWQNRNMRNHTNSSVLLGGHVYGNDEGKLVCVDLKDGRTKWRGPGIGRGGLMAADGKLIVISERGELFTVAADPTRYTELSRASVGRGDYWTHPVLANGRIYVRSHEGDLTCLDVRGK